MTQVGDGADEFLRERTRRVAKIRTGSVGTNGTSEQHVQRPDVDLRPELLMKERPRVTHAQAPVWRPDDFVPGHLAYHVSFWEEEILSVCTPQERATFLRWLRGVDVREFIDPQTEGTFQGQAYRGSEMTAVELPNHVPEAFESFVDQQVEKYTQSGVVVPWEMVADIEKHPKPQMVMPLGVEESKPRAFLDARWLNLMGRKCPFQMDAVGKVAQCAWPGAFQMTADHKSGFHHVPLDAGSWQYFGFAWRGRYYVFTVLCFGWCSSPYIYHSLSAVVSRYLRTKGIPVLTWIDDFYFTNFRASRGLAPKIQAEAATVTAYVVMHTFYEAGYFVSIDKCELDATTRLIFLGVVCDSVEEKFIIPDDKLDKLETILVAALKQEVISFHMLEKLAGKCTSMSVACPAAALYTHHMYQAIGKYQRQGGRKRNTEIDVPKNGGLRVEMEKWMEVRQTMNGASWYKALHQTLHFTGASDASSRGWGGLIRCPGEEVFKAAGDFPDEWLTKHINEQEAYALKQTLVLYCKERPAQVTGSTIVMDVDNKALFHAVKRGRSTNSRMHEVITELFWLQVKEDFTLSLQWVCSKDNAEADDLSRPDADAYVRLEAESFAKLWKWSGKGFDMDWMATDASGHRVPDSGDRLPFYSRFHVEGCAGTDVLSQDLRYMPDSTTPCFGFCFPPTAMVGVVLQRMAECKAQAVVIVPDQQNTWYPMLADATVRSMRLTKPAERAVFYRMNHQKGKVSFAFRRWAMRAVEVSFADK